MATDQFPPLLSYDDYAAIDDDRRYEVIDGVLLLTPAPSAFHQALLYELAVQFAPLRARGTVLFAPSDVVFRSERPAMVLQPDLFFVRRERQEIVTEANLRGAPDLVVEVLSPSTSRRDLRDKRLIYARFGVAEYWIVDAKTRQVRVFRARPEADYAEPVMFGVGDRVETILAPGFALDVAALFAVLDPRS